MRRVCLFTVLLPLAFAQDSQRDAKKDPDQIGTRDVSKGVNFYSIGKEMTLGKMMAEDIEKTHKLVGDPQVNEYVNRVGQNLARHSDSKIPITFKVIEGDEPNAITIPGGYIYVQTGLIQTADAEAQLAAALAHEIAHVAARHATRQATQGQIEQITTIPLFFAPGLGGICAFGASRFFGPAGLLAIGRGYEAEADMLGLQYLYKAGYDPLGMVEIFERIFSVDAQKDAQKKGKTNRIFATHPDGDNRLVAVQKNIETLLKPLPEYIVSTSAFADAQARLITLEWNKTPEPAAPKAPTLHKAGDEIAKAKKFVPSS